MISMAMKIGLGALATVAVGAIVIVFTLGVPKGVASASNSADATEAKVASTKSAPEPILLAQSDAKTSAPAGVLPGGASSLQEGYQDWLVVCGQQAGAAGQPATKICSMTQQQNNKDGQRVLAIELRPVGDSFEGALFLPFGLKLDKGATLQVDDGEASQPLKFRTCLPAGCIVPLSFDAAYMGALQKGTAIKIKTVADGGTDTPFAVSLKGFGAASARLQALAE